MMKYFFLLLFLFNSCDVNSIQSPKGQDFWFYVKEPGLSEDIGTDPQLFIDNGIIYAAFRDKGYAEALSIRMFDGDRWLYLGERGDLGILSQFVFFVDQGIPYIAYRDYSEGFCLTVKKYVNGQWQILGDRIESERNTQSNALAFFVRNGVPYLVFSDKYYQGRISALRFQNNRWEYAGAPGFSKGLIEQTSLFVDDQFIYAAYNDQACDGRLSVQRLPLDGSGSWSFMAGEGFSEKGGSVGHIQLRVIQGIPYVAYRTSFYQERVVVQKYHYYKWVYIAEHNDYGEPWGPNPGISPGIVSGYRFFIGEGGQLYLAYSDLTHYQDLVVKSFMYGKWQSIGKSPNKTGNNYLDMFVYQNTPFILFGDNAANGRLSVLTEGKSFIQNFRKVKTPSSSLASGSYEGAQTVSLSTETEGAAIYYTLDGSYPDKTSGTLYTAPVSIAKSSKIRAAAYKTDWADSDAALFEITIQNTAAQPSFSLVPGYYSDAKTLEMSTITPGASIRYTLDGTIPSQSHGFVYGGALILSETVTVKAVAYTASAVSDVSTALYEIRYWKNAGNPGFSTGSVSSIVLKISPSGVPYVAFLNSANEKKVTVMKLSGGVWTVVGAAGISEGEAGSISMAFNSAGNPIVGYQDGAYMGHLAVKEWNGSVWVEKPSVSLPDTELVVDRSNISGTIPDDQFYWLSGVLSNEQKPDVRASLFFYQNQIFAGYQRISKVVFKAIQCNSCVNYYDDLPKYYGVVNKPFEMLCSPADCNRSEGVVKAGVMVFDEGSQSWRQMGEEWVIGNPVRVGELGILVSGSVEFFAENNQYYIAYNNHDADYRMNIRKYSETGGWEVLGDENMSSGFASNLLLYGYEGNVYTGFNDYGEGGKFFLKKYLGRWIGGFLNLSTYASALTGEGEHLYIAFVEAAGEKISMIKFSDYTAQVIGKRKFSTQTSYSDISIAVYQGIPFVAYRDAMRGGKITVMRYE